MSLLFLSHHERDRIYPGSGVAADLICFSSMVGAFFQYQTAVAAFLNCIADCAVIGQGICIAFPD